MPTKDSSPLSDEERAELERLRAAQAAAQQANADALARKELEQLRKNQKYAKEDAEYYAERERRKAEKEKAREHPDYGVDDLPPMPLRQKIVLIVVVVLVVALIFYLIAANAGLI